MRARSAIYRGTVRHRRMRPVEHAFRSAVGMLYLDLDELPEALDASPLWSARRPAPGRFRREDFLGDPATPLADAVRALVAARTDAPAPAGPVRLLTTPRTFGRAFNPVSFYFLFAQDGDTLRAVVADVTNTPWGESHAYVVPVDEPTRVVDASLDKVFHVSPFMGMEHRYRWRLTTPGDTLSIHIESADDDGPLFDATLNLRRRPLSGRALSALLLRFPFTALRTLGLIYSHGLRLKLKGAPSFPHPDRARGARGATT